MNNSSNRKKKKTQPAYETLTILDRDKTDPKTNMSYPSPQAVEEGKRAVDKNQL